MEGEAPIEVLREAPARIAQLEDMEEDAGRVDRRLQRVAIPGWGGHGQGNSTASLARISMLQHSLRAVRSGAWQYLDLARSQWCRKSHCEVWVVRGAAALVAGGVG